MKRRSITPRRVLEVHRGQGPPRLPRQAAVGPAQEARPRERSACPNGRSCAALASAIKEHTLIHLADYLEEFERNAIANGAHVHWARDAAEHNQIVHDILERARCASTLVKSKSMLTDECDMRPVPRDSAASRSSRPISASASSSSTTSRRATSSCPRSTSCAATSPGCSRSTIGTDPKQQRRPLSRGEPAPAHAAVLPEAPKPA